MLNEIIDVDKVHIEGRGEFSVTCPHCERVVGIEGEGVGDIAGSQYQHRVCSGWFQVTSDATFIKLPKEH